MNYIEVRKLCEEIIKPYKDKLSSEALAEIYSIRDDYCFDLKTDRAYTDYELKELEETQEYELCCWIHCILIDNGFEVL